MQTYCNKMDIGWVGLMVRKFVHQWSWIALVLFCCIGSFFPVIGVLALICMLAPVVVSFFKGRMWCGSFCPRGSFNDIVLAKVSKKLHIPKLFKQKWFKILILALVMGGFVLQIIYAQLSLEGIGQVFVRMILVTTLLSIILGVIFNQRTWCSICPMGTMAKLVAGNEQVKKKIKHVTFDKSKCISCNICTKSCPIEIKVLEHRDHGKVIHDDCLKCEACVEKCPKKCLKIS